MTDKLKPVAQYPREWDGDYTKFICTNTGLISELDRVAEALDEMGDACAAELMAAASRRLQQMQTSLRQEVGRLDTLQPFFTAVSSAVDKARKTKGRTDQ